MSPQRPRGVRAAAHWFSRFCALACWLTLIIWIAGRLATDRWLWSQYIFWIPEELEAVVASVLLLATLITARLARAPQRGRARLLLPVAVAIFWAHLAVVHWRAWNMLTRPARGATPAAVRILNWNLTAVEATSDITSTVFPLNPDIAVLVNPHSRPEWARIIQEFGDPKALIWESNIIVLSHIHIVRHGSMLLGVTAPEPGRRWTDPGRAMFVELDTTERLGRTTVIWIIDMPSNWRLSRWDTAKQAAEAIAGWAGPRMVHDRAGNVRPEQGGPGFPAPDVVMGDFNAPRGSASLSLLAPGMVNAFDQGGAGYAASWPGYGYRYTHPVTHIDQMFVGPRLRAARYEIVKPLFGYHWPQWAEIVSR